MTDYPDERDDILDTFEAIEEQLVAVPHKTEHVKDKLAALAEAQRQAYPIADLYANVWAGNRQAEGSRELLSAMGLNADLGTDLEPGTHHEVEATVGSSDLLISGTVDEEGRMWALDVAEDGVMLNREKWMGTFHDYFALLLVVDLKVKSTMKA
jgi:hypothetical protein